MFRRLLVWLGWSCPHCFSRRFTGWVFGGLDLTAHYRPASFFRFCRDCGEQQWRSFGTFKPLNRMREAEYIKDWSCQKRQWVRIKHGLMRNAETR